MEHWSVSAEAEPFTLPDLTPMYAEVGHGISLFSLVELNLGACFASMLEPADRRHSIEALNACRSFEAKKKMVDALAPVALDPEHLARWKKLSRMIGRRKDTRDKLAHWTVSLWPGMTSVEDLRNVRPALIPPIFTRAHMDVLWLKQHERKGKEKPLFKEDLECFRLLTTELTKKLIEFALDVGVKHHPDNP
jgi:hypothetical protein